MQKFVVNCEKGRRIVTLGVNLGEGNETETSGGKNTMCTGWLHFTEQEHWGDTGDSDLIMGDGISLAFCH